MLIQNIRLFSEPLHIQFANISIHVHVDKYFQRYSIDYCGSKAPYRSSFAHIDLMEPILICTVIEITLQ
jgi:hypothetical protein